MSENCAGLVVHEVRAERDLEEILGVDVDGKGLHRGPLRDHGPNEPVVVDHRAVRTEVPRDSSGRRGRTTRP